MEKKYSQQTLAALKNELERVENGVTFVYKPIPETDEPGAMDPRVYKAAKKMNLMMKFVPKKKMAGMMDNPVSLRKMFNGIKSIPVTREDMRTERLFVPGGGGEIPILIYYPKIEIKNLPVLYFIHGGGFFAGSPDVVEQACKMITDFHPCITVSVDYRLAPENPYPAGFDDVYTVLEWISANIAERGGDPNRIAVTGDSAGGTLCIFCALKSREMGKNYVKLVIPYYPTVNMAGVADEFYRKPTLDQYEIAEKYKKYCNPVGMAGSMNMLGTVLGASDTSDPHLSPYLADLTDFPPTLLMFGEHDFLAIEDKAFAAKLTKAGVPLRTVVYRGMGHAFVDQIGVAPQAEDSILEVSKAMTKYLDTEEANI